MKANRRKRRHRRRFLKAVVRLLSPGTRWLWRAGEIGDSTVRKLLGKAGYQ